MLTTIRRSPTFVKHDLRDVLGLERRGCLEVSWLFANSKEAHCGSREVSKNILDAAKKRIDREVVVVVSLKGSPKKGRGKIQEFELDGATAGNERKVLGSLKTR